jgi:hypothetical protein
MGQDTRSRKWVLTINNPAEHGFLHDKIKEILAGMPVTYWCMADEKGEKETHHTHLFIQNTNALRFSTIKKAFPPAHIEEARGTAQENRDYVAKEGKWEEDEKHGTKIDGTFEEWGDLPAERQGARTDLAELYEMILDGKVNCEIYRHNPELIRYHGLIEQVRQDHRYEQNKGVFRNVKVIYIWGSTGVGKTSLIYGRHCYEDIHRVTDYKHPFDDYTGEPVMMFDEFRAQLPLTDMNNYLDRYPLKLPSRYVNKQASYTTVYIVSNIPLREQYHNVKREHPEVWRSFMRRIGLLQEMLEDRTLITHDVQKHITGVWSKETPDWVEELEQDELPL